GDDRTGKDDGKYRTPLTKPLRHEPGYRRHRAAIFHQFSEKGTEEEYWEELREELRCAAHEGLSPVSQQRFAGKSRGNESTGRREQEYTPSPEGKPDEQC